jgi:phytoene dehydrogenase-like protein
MAKYDIVALGGGHNGLTAAAYMAKAGKKVLVLERKPWAGGGVATRELTLPGFRHDEHSSVHIMIQGNPMITADELGLFSRFGLEYKYSDVPHVTIFPDQTVLITYKDLDRTCQGIARMCGERDAEAYRRFAERSMQLLPMFMQGLYAPPLPMGAFVAMLDQSDEGRELFEMMSRSSVEIAEHYFESDRLRIHLVRLVTENLQMPDELGTGMGVFLMPGLIHSYGVSQPIGGSGRLSESLIRAIQAYGGEVRVNAEVARIVTSGGRAVGVELTDGETIAAKDGVIGALHPHVLRKFVSGIPEPVLRRAERVTPSTFSLHLSHYALAEKARFRAGAEAGRATLLEMVATDDWQELLGDFDLLRRGRLPDRRLSAGGDPSINDPTRAPAGMGTFYGVTFAPYNLADGGPARWDEIKLQVAEENLAHYRLFIENMDDANLLAKSIYSPLDMERSSPNSFVRGDVHGCAPFFYQTLAHRPTPDLGNLTVPGVDRLYLVGPFMHPGGGVFGAGRGTAIKMMDDLGIDFDRVVG